jgi:hypothetical protein
MATTLKKQKGNRFNQSYASGNSFHKDMQLD